MDEQLDKIEKIKAEEFENRYPSDIFLDKINEMIETVNKLINGQNDVVAKINELKSKFYKLKQKIKEEDKNKNILINDLTTRFTTLKEKEDQIL